MPHSTRTQSNELVHRSLHSPVPVSLAGHSGQAFFCALQSCSQPCIGVTTVNFAAHCSINLHPVAPLATLVAAAAAAAGRCAARRQRGLQQLHRKRQRLGHESLGLGVQVQRQARQEEACIRGSSTGQVRCLARKDAGRLTHVWQAGCSNQACKSRRELPGGCSHRLQHGVAGPRGSWRGSCTPAAPLASAPGAACLQMAREHHRRGVSLEVHAISARERRELQRPKRSVNQTWTHCWQHAGRAAATDQAAGRPCEPLPDAGNTVASSLSSSSTRGAGQASARSSGSRRHSASRSCARCRRARASVAA